MFFETFARKAKLQTASVARGLIFELCVSIPAARADREPQALDAQLFGSKALFIQRKVCLVLMELRMLVIQLFSFAFTLRPSRFFSHFSETYRHDRPTPDVSIPFKLWL